MLEKYIDEIVYKIFVSMSSLLVVILSKFNVLIVMYVVIEPNQISE